MSDTYTIAEGSAGRGFHRAWSSALAAHHHLLSLSDRKLTYPSGFISCHWMQETFSARPVCSHFLGWIPPLFGYFALIIATLLCGNLGLHIVSPLLDGTLVKFHLNISQIHSLHSECSGNSIVLGIKQISFWILAPPLTIFVTLTLILWILFSL